MSVHIARQRIVELAAAMLSGQVELLEGTRSLVAATRGLPDEERTESVFLLLRGIDSDLDDYPLGEVRKLWSPEALKERDDREFLKRNEQLILGACAELLEKYQASDSSDPDRSAIPTGGSCRPGAPDPGFPK